MKRQTGSPRRDAAASAVGGRLRDLTRALITTILVLLFVALVVLLLQLDKLVKDSRVPRNVHLLGEHLGGAPKETAVKRAREVLEAIAARRIHVVFRDRCFRLDPARDIGFRVETERTVARLLAVGHEGSLLSQMRVRIRLHAGRDRVDLPVRYYYDKEKLRAFADLVSLAVARAPEAARVVEGTSGKRLVRERTGVGLSARAIAEQILAGIERLESYRAGTVFLKAEVITPTIDFATKISQLGCREVASFTVPLPDDPAYRERAAVAAERLDGIILTGAEKLSLAARLADLPPPSATPRDEATGFHPDPAALGPVASAVYNACLLAGFDLLERKPHRHARADGGYVEPGRDAALSPPDTDLALRARRNANTILAVRLTREGGFTVAVHCSAPLPGELELVTRDLKLTEPPERRFLDPSLARGAREVLKEGQPGIEVALERTLKRGGAVVDRAPIARDAYQPLERHVRAGEKER